MAPAEACSQKRAQGRWLALRGSSRPRTLRRRSSLSPGNSLGSSMQLTRHLPARRRSGSVNLSADVRPAAGAAPDLDAARPRRAAADRLPGRAACERLPTAVVVEVRFKPAGCAMTSNRPLPVPGSMGCSHTIIPASEGTCFALYSRRESSRVRWIRGLGVPRVESLVCPKNAGCADSAPRSANLPLPPTSGLAARISGPRRGSNEGTVDAPAAMTRTVKIRHTLPASSR